MEPKTVEMILIGMSSEEKERFKDLIAECQEREIFLADSAQKNNQELLKLSEAEKVFAEGLVLLEAVAKDLMAVSEKQERDLRTAAKELSAAKKKQGEDLNKLLEAVSDRLMAVNGKLERALLLQSFPKEEMFQS